MTVITPVVMAGGSGTRLWPVSRSQKPKQFQSLTGDLTMLGETLARFVGGHGALRFADPVIIAGAHHADAAEASVDGLDVRLGQLILEPAGRNTAPAAVVAAHHVAQSDPNGLVLMLPADHHISRPEVFLEALETAAPIAADGYLTTFGIHPDRPETGYGYIRKGSDLASGAYRVDAFVEKPDAETAATYLAEGTYSWNAGIFLFSASALLDEARRHALRLTVGSVKAYDEAQIDGIRRHLDEAAFTAIEGDSIDYAFMEKTSQAALVGPLDMGWNDVGSWESLADLLAGGSEVTQTAGDVIALDTDRCFIRSDGPLVAAIGVEDLVIVATDGAILVTRADQSQDVKSIVDTLKAKGRKDVL